MELKDKILSDMRDSMKERNDLRTNALRMLRAEILKKENEKPGARADDATVLWLVQKLIKQRKEAAELYERGARPELAQKELEEAKILETYLPPEASDEEIAQVIRDIISETGASGVQDMGKLMGPVMARLRETGKTVEGKRVNQLVRTALTPANNGRIPL